MNIKEWQREVGRVVFSPVANTVLFANPNISPLRLEVGEPSPLGIFADRSYSSDEAPRLIKGQQVLQVWSGHDRSIRAAQVLFADAQGHVYRDIDLKGIGHVRWGYGDWSQRPVSWVGKPGKDRHDGGRDGLLNRDTAFPTWEWAEKFVKAGIRTYRILAIIGLEELMVNGDRINIEEARARDIVDKDFYPVVEVRAFGTKARVSNLSFSNWNPGDLIDDAKQLIARELRIPIFSNDEYVLWFARTLGINVGLMHGKSWVHSYLTDHNITLDCCIVDLDSVREVRGGEGQPDDKSTAKMTLNSLLLSMNETSLRSKAFEQFEEGYRGVFEEVSSIL